MIRAARAALALGVLAAAFVPSALAQTAEDCLACHGDASLTAERHGRTVSLHVDGGAFRNSVHKDLACVDCHARFKPDEMPHASPLRPVDCTTCHGDAASSHAFHLLPGKGGAAAGSVFPAGVACSACHGTHDIRARSDPASPVHPAHLADTCGRCHKEVVDHFKRSAHGQALQAGQAGAPQCLTCHRAPITLKQRPEDGAALKLDQERLCLSCHLDNPDVRARMNPSAGFIASFKDSVHGAALAAGDARAANCVDCHGSHEMEKGIHETARVNKRRIPETCGQCHADVARAYLGSVHGQAVARGNGSAPVCTDCHGEHGILSPSNPMSPVAPENVSAKVCSKCHSSISMASKYGLASDRFKTFSDSYHGLAIRGGVVEVANCASCHGAHDILPSSDPRSSVSRARLAETCGRCHPGANERFAVGRVHVALSPTDDPVIYWIATGYVALIVLTIGGMALHNGLDFVRRSRRRLRARLGGGDAGHAEAGRGLYLRMTVGERWQHGALLVSFVTLVATGFMLHFPDAFWVAGLRRLVARLFDLRSLLHRSAGVLLLSASAFHLGYLAFTARGRQFLRDMRPGRADLADALGVLRYNLGLASAKPAFGRFSYVEKSEYWALVWGTIVMGTTGALLWFENRAMALVTKLGLDVARTIHFYEAWLATLAILVWHFYYVIFNPDVYPMSTAWFTGFVSEEEMRDEHPLELEAIERQRLEEAVRREEAARAESEERGGTS